MSDTHKNRLLEEFQSYLESVDFSQLASDQTPDLSVLLNEMVGLKTEVRAEARQFKNTLDTLTVALNTLQNDNSALAIELELYNNRLQQQRIELSRTILSDVVDIYDRLLAGLATLQNHKPTASFFGKKTDDRFINSIREGQEILLKRLEHLLLRHQIAPIECLGKLLDPHTMSAVEIGRDPKLANGMVIEELRKGFMFGQDVLRLAEVKVNKL
jgi:molecular chaperone GrpE